MFKKIVRLILKAIFILTSRLVYRVKIEGKENIKKDGGYILCGNHVHAMDAPVFVVNSRRRMIFIAKEELFRFKILKFLAYVFDVIPVKRNSNDTSTMKRSMQALKNGEILGIFPEGTRNGLAKNVVLKTGAAAIAIKTNTKIIPLGINGSFKPFTTVTYRIGEPMDFSKYAGTKPDKELLEKVTKEVMDKIIELAK